ncbi:MAG: GNAT family N-acetyltransferase, partial [Actinobacteria bacterium]|nr:GNAT family N-acetyltransferase [Actinomycetota bacterium]
SAPPVVPPRACVAAVAGVPSGLLFYRVEGDECELVVLITERSRQGIGGALVEALYGTARGKGCVRLWLVTTNDNEAAQAFYEALGWRRVAIHRGAVRQARTLKPEIPEYDQHGNPIEDEYEYEYEPRHTG